MGHDQNGNYYPSQPIDQNGLIDYETREEPGYDPQTEKIFQKLSMLIYTVQDIKKDVNIIKETIEKHFKEYER
jgi:hypothetical protein